METSFFDETYRREREHLLGRVLERLQECGFFQGEKSERVGSVPPRPSLRHTAREADSGRELLERVLDDLLECVAPGAHDVVSVNHEEREARETLGGIADRLYAVIVHALRAVSEEKEVKERASMTTFALLWDLPVLKERSWWNRFAALRDPAVWDAYLLENCTLDREALAGIDFVSQLDEAIRKRDPVHYRYFVKELGCESFVDYQMRLVTSTYPGWRVLFYHDVAHALTLSGPLQDCPELERRPVPFLPRAISELGGRYYQADLHPETLIGDANFLDHTHRGITTGQTGVIGSGCHLLPCTLGGLSEKVQQRHPIIGNHVFIGTDAGLFGPVLVEDNAIIGPNAEIHGKVEIGAGCHIGASVFIGTIKSGERMPGRVRLGAGVRVGAGTIIENGSELDLVIPDKADIPARRYVTNDGFGSPEFVRA